MYTWQNSDLQNIGEILENAPGSGSLSFTIKNVIVYLTDTTANGDPLANPAIGYPIDNAVFISIENTSATQNVIFDDINTLEAGSPIITFPNAGNVVHSAMTVKCEAGATATIIYQYKQTT